MLKILKNKCHIWNQHLRNRAHAKFKMLERWYFLARKVYIWAFRLEIWKTKTSGKFQSSPISKCCFPISGGGVVLAGFESFRLVLAGFRSFWHVPGFSKYAVRLWLLHTPPPPPQKKKKKLYFPNYCSKWHSFLPT